MAASPWRGRPPKRRDADARRPPGGGLPSFSEWRAAQRGAKAPRRPRPPDEPTPFAVALAWWRRAKPPVRVAAVLGAAAGAALAIALAGVVAEQSSRLTERSVEARRHAMDRGRLAPRPSTEAPRPPSAAAVPPRPDPLRDMAGPTVALLTAPARDAPQPFVLLPYVTPDVFCRRLADSGLPGATFRADEPPSVGWTCFTDLIKPIPGDDATVASLFVTARGLTPHSLDIVRLKLNLIDPAGNKRVARLARETLRNVFELMGFRAPEAPLVMIDGLQTKRIELAGVTYDLRREFGTPLRVNMIVTFPRRLGVADTDAFSPRPRRAGPLERPDPAPDPRDDAAQP